MLRIELDVDKHEARRIVRLHQAGKVHRESRETALHEAVRRGRTPSGDPTFVGITNGEPARLVYDVPVYSDVAD